jgi:hypothetical protein
VLLLQQLPFKSLSHEHTHTENPVLACHIARLKAFMQVQGFIRTPIGAYELIREQLNESTDNSIPLFLSLPTCFLSFLLLEM